MPISRLNFEDSAHLEENIRKTFKNRRRMPKIGFTGSRLAHSAQNSKTNPMELVPESSFAENKSKIRVGGSGEALKKSTFYGHMTCECKNAGEALGMQGTVLT